MTVVHFCRYSSRPNEMLNNTAKIRSLEGIRGIACFIVILSHLSLLFFPYLHSFNIKSDTSYSFQYVIHNSPFGFLYSGTAAVYIFFVLSGYVLSFVSKDIDSRKLLALSIKRYPRLMIPAVVSCIFAYVLFNLISVETTPLSNWVNLYRKYDLTFIGAIYSGTLQAFLTGNSRYNTVLWTMKIELIGSLLVFIMCYFKFHLRVKYTEYIFIALLFIQMRLGYVSELMGLGLFAFIAGHLVLTHGRKIRPELTAFLFIVGVYLAGIHDNSASYSFITALGGKSSYELGNFAAGVLLVYSIVHNDRLNSFFSNGLFMFMGKVSFSAYLIHASVLSTLGVFCFNWLFNYFIFAVAAIASSVFVVAATYLISVFYYQYVDRIGILFSDRVQQKLYGLMS
jgi:peptidoglycan/LPS O-acetylase OafA/YrhL